MIKSPSLRIFWYVLLCIASMIAVTWLSESTALRAFFGNTNYESDWISAQIESTLILAIGIPFPILVYRLLTRIEQLESFITMCA